MQCSRQSTTEACMSLHLLPVSQAIKPPASFWQVRHTRRGVGVMHVVGQCCTVWQWQWQCAAHWVIIWSFSTLKKPPCPSAGYETTANALAYTCFLIACNPGVPRCSASPVRRMQARPARRPPACGIEQRFPHSAPTCSSALRYAVLCCAADKEAQLLAEVDAWGCDNAPTPQDLASFPIARACFWESLRLFLPAPRISRIVESGAALGGLAVPAGTMEQARRLLLLC